VTITREQFAKRPGASLRGPNARLVLPCGPDRGCTYEACEGWVQVKDDPFELRWWTRAEVAEARAWRDATTTPEGEDA
jgi:hypothetical protein